MTLRQNAFFLQLHGQIEPRLSSDPGQNSVRPLFTHYFGNVFESQGLHVDLVRDGRVGHDRRRVGIAQDHFVAFLLESEAGLGPGIVEFGGLPDHDRTGAYDKNLVYVGAFRHGAPPLCLQDQGIRRVQHCRV